MIETKMRVRGGGSNYRNFVNFEWVSEVAGCGVDILKGIPDIVRFEWRDGGVQVEQDDEGISFSWQSIRPYDFVHAFARNFPQFEITATYRHMHGRYIGVSLHKGAVTVQKFKDFLDSELPYPIPEDPEHIDKVCEEIVMGLLNDVRAEMYVLEINRNMSLEVD